MEGVADAIRLALTHARFGNTLGSFLAYGVFDRISVKKRSSLGPLGTAKGSLQGDIMAIAAGGIAYVLMLLYGHTYLIGVPLVRMSFAP